MKKFITIFLLAGLAACGGPDKPQLPPVPTIPIMGHSIVGTYKHDTSSYTEGLLIYKGSLYESGGNYGSSKLKKIDLATGKTEKEIALDKKYFGEGITILRDTIYQLTYKEKKAFAYNLDLKKIKEYDVDIPEGWGMTTDGTNLIIGTGGSDLLYYDPSTFKLLKTQTIMESGSPMHDINELEYINGYIYANQYGAPYIYKIDPASGVVIAKADISSTWARIKTMRPGVNEMDIVPNGIAYDADTKKIYITGKWWPELYEVQFSQ